MGTEVDGNAISHYWSVLTLEKGYGLFFLEIPLLVVIRVLFV